MAGVSTFLFVFFIIIYHYFKNEKFVVKYSELMSC